MPAPQPARPADDQQSRSNRGKAFQRTSAFAIEPPPKPGSGTPNSTYQPPYPSTVQKIIPKSHTCCVESHLKQRHHSAQHCTSPTSRATNGHTQHHTHKRIPPSAPYQTRQTHHPRGRMHKLHTRRNHRQHSCLHLIRHLMPHRNSHTTPESAHPHQHLPSTRLGHCFWAP